MKTVNSGIIRSMDDLGRVVIPKEMRKMADVKMGDSFEVGFANGCIILEKYTGEIDKETGKPISKPQVNEETVKQEPKKYYIDVCDRRVFVNIEDITKVMVDNGDVISFEGFLCQEYTAGALYDMYATYGVEETEKTLHEEYVNYATNEAQELLDCLRNTDYIEVMI